MKCKKRRNFKPIFILALVAIPIILLNIGKIYEVTYGMLDTFIVRPAKETSADLVQTAPSTYSESNFRSEIYKNFNKKVTTPFTGGSVSYETLISNANLFMAERKEVPWERYSVRRNSDDVANGNRNAKHDAFFDIRDAEWVNPEMNVAGAEGGTMRVFTRATNVFGVAKGSVALTSRTLARYSAGDGKLNTSLKQGISYILAHNKSTAFETDKVQQALWLMRLKGNSDINENMSRAEADVFALETIKKEYIGLNRQAAVLSVNLFIEAKALQDYMNAREELRKNNNGQEIIDNMAGKYQKGEAGLVSYNSEKAEFYVGPFSFNYLRKVLIPIDGANSEAINSDGTVIISQIDSANLYGMVKNGEEYEEQLITDWEFVYTDVEYNVKEQKPVRTFEKEAFDAEDKTLNIFPYPNETFYLKIKTDNVEALTRIEFGMQNLNATSEVYILNGTFSNVSWRVRQQDGENGKFYLESNKDSIMAAAQLYSVKGAKIVEEHKDISLSLGFVQPGYEVYDGVCIPMTMNFGGRVWYDGTEVDEKAGVVDAIYTPEGENPEKGIANVKVYLYDNNDNLIQSTSTAASGRYQFKYVKAGKMYYVKFEYDGMKYKPTKLLGGNASVDNYTENMAAFGNMSHALEEAEERATFNNSFYEIAADKAISTTGKQKNVSYTYDRYNPVGEQGMGTIAKVQEFPMESYTNKTARIVYPLHRNYIITNIANNILQTNDKNQPNYDDLHYIIGFNYENEFYYVASAPSIGGIATNTGIGTKFTKSQDCLNNINLGLLERDSSDFAIKTDVTQTIYTLNEVVSNSNLTDFGEKADLDFDIVRRTGNYYYSNYVQKLGYDEYSWRYDYMDNEKVMQNDELQLYIQYKITIKNQSNLLSGYITELADYYDKELYYPVDTDERWRYYDKNTNYMTSANGYADITMPQLTQYSSWAIKNNGRDDKIELGQVKWKSTSIYGNKNNNYNLNKMYTTSLQNGNAKLAPGEEIDIFIIFKVERDRVRDKEGLYIINDNADIGKRNISEINGYRALNYDSTPGGRIDQDSNPGNANLDNVITYEDNIDSAPYLRVTVNPKDNGKGLSGYVWEDSRTGGLGRKLENNQIVGNGKIDKRYVGNREVILENFVNNVKVELIRMEYDKQKDQYIEVSFADDYEERSGNQIVKYTGPQAGTVANSEYEITTGGYRFDNVIESGTYKIRFTYGTEKQLRNFVNIKNEEDSVKYNGHDYKSTEYGGPIDLRKVQDLDTKIAILIDSSTSISETTLNNVKNTISTLKKNLITLNPNVDVTILNYAQEANIVNDMSRIVPTPGDNLAEGIQLAVNVLNKEIPTGGYVGNRIMVIIGDGYGNTPERAKTLIKKSLEAGIKVIGIGIEGANTDTFKISTQYNREEAKVMYYNLVNYEDYTSNKLYNLIYDYMVKHLILIKDRSHATDYLENTTVMTDKTSKDLRGRLQVLEYSQRMIPEIANVLNTDYINSLERDIKQNSEWSRAVRELAEYTQMTADSYIVSINFEDNAGVSKQLNLGLQEIPKSEIEVKNKVEDMTVTLSNGRKIVSLKEQATQNVQIIPDSIYSIYLDEELMQGAKIDVIYKISVSNIGEVDSFWPYVRYSDFETKKHFYGRLYQNIYGVSDKRLESITEAELDELLFNVIPVKIKRVYDYYDNLIFRAEENGNWQIVNNNLKLNDDGTPERDDYQNIIFTNDDSKRYIRQDYTAMWKETHNPQVVDRVKDRVKKYLIVETDSLRNIALYPSISKPVLNGAEVSSVSTYLKLSKTLSAKDLDDKSALQYMNYTEINGTESLNGRRDYEGAVGNYKPGTAEEGIEEDKTKDFKRDTSIAEKIIILPPFGEAQTMIALAVACGSILTFGIIIIKRKFMDK